MALTITIKKESEYENKATVDVLDNKVSGKDIKYSIMRRVVRDTIGNEINGEIKIIHELITKNEEEDAELDKELSFTYNDEDCIDIASPGSIKIIDNMNKGKNRVYYEFEEVIDIGTCYEYTVERISDGKRELSNKAECITISELKEYEYAVISTDGERDLEVPIESEWIRTNKTEFTYKLQYAGYNSVFIRSVDKAGNYGISFIDNLYINSEVDNSHVKGNVPQAIKYNNRYRGPHESKKVDNLYSQIKFNLHKIKERLKELDIKKDEILEKPINYNNIIIIKADTIEELYTKIKDRQV